jgi:tRNA(His) guanylyltransferase
MVSQEEHVSKDDLGDRMKSYEAEETSRRFDPHLPVYARIDGRGFSKFTRHMDRPFDTRMLSAMIGTTQWLVEHTHAAIGYVQSDEISLVWPGSETNDSHFFAGKIQKSCSVLASMAAARFSVEYLHNFGEFSTACPHFDCRVIQLPNEIEAANMLLWRELDARKNSVSMLARHHFSHRDLQNKDQRAMLEMLADKGVRMDDQMQNFQRGTWLRRVVEDHKLTAEELLVIPEQHRPDPEAVVTRSRVQAEVLPPFNTVANRVGVIFRGEHPVTA